MKKSFIFGCLAILFFQASFAVESKLEYLEKMYVEPGQVFVADDGIYIKIHDSLFSVKTISRDENGLYAEGFEGSAARCMVCGRQFDDSKNEPWCPHKPRRR